MTGSAQPPAKWDESNDYPKKGFVRQKPTRHARSETLSLTRPHKKSAGPLTPAWLQQTKIAASKLVKFRG
jgi:hypothetical protein